MPVNQEGQHSRSALSTATNQKHREACSKCASALRENDEALSLALNAGRAGIFTWNFATGHVEWSEGLERLYGVPPGTFEGTLAAWERRVVPEDAARVIDGLREALSETRDEYSYEFRAILPGGALRWFYGQSRFLYNTDKHPMRMLGINIDIHQRKLAEAALVENERLVITGRLLSSISHEINNPLESISNLLYLARTSKDLSEADGYLATAENQLKRVSEITRQTLRFQRQSSEPTACDLADMISGTLLILQSRLTAQAIKVERSDGKDIQLQCQEGEIRQVLLNLISNAIDAMPDGGTLTIRTRPGRNPQSSAWGVYVTVKDTGTGMSAATQRTLFDAFFTTKGLNGTGLGLWISKDIVDRQKGTLRLRSSESPQYHGTTFRLFLPLTATAGATGDAHFTATEGR